MTLQLDTPWSTLVLTWRAQSRLELVQKLQENCVFTFPFANPFCGLFCNFFLLHNLSKYYSVRFMAPFLYNSFPISQKGGVAVLCPVAVLGTFPCVCSIGPISVFLTEVLYSLCAISTFICEQVKPLNFAPLPEK